MRRAQPHFAASQRAEAHADSIEWEELPSLAGSLAQRLVRRGSWQRGPAPQRGANDSDFGVTGGGQPWDNTMPAALDPVHVSQPFQEPLPGLAAREVFEPGVFQHFFGSPAAADHHGR